MQAACQEQFFCNRRYDTGERKLRTRDKKSMKPADPNASKLTKLKLTNPQRGIAQAKPTAKRGPQVPRSSKRP